MGKSKREIITIGRREWACLPDLNIKAIQFKTDTGAATSALHALDIDLFQRDGEQWVRFNTHSKADEELPHITCEARVFEFRNVTNSGGKTERRPVIKTTLLLGDYKAKIQLTLTGRSDMAYSMLLGRRAMQNRMLVDPARLHLHGDKNTNCQED